MRCFGITPDVVQISNDAPDLDNTMNTCMLSVLSSGADLCTYTSNPLAVACDFYAQSERLLVTTDDFETYRNWKITRALYLSDGVDKVFPAGGNNIAGVLGQIGGALELAEQISAGLVEDVSRIYLPIGSLHAHRADHRHCNRTPDRPERVS